MPPPPRSFAQILGDLISEQGYDNPSAFAAAHDMNPQTVHRLLNGERGPKWETVQKLATALGVTTDTFRDQP